MIVTIDVRIVDRREYSSQKRSKNNNNHRKKSNYVKKILQKRDYNIIFVLTTPGRRCLWKMTSTRWTRLSVGWDFSSTGRPWPCFIGNLRSRFVAAPSTVFFSIPPRRATTTDRRLLQCYDTLVVEVMYVWVGIWPPGVHGRLVEMPSRTSGK